METWVTALTNGLHIRTNKSSGTYRTLTNWKDGGDLVNDMYDVTYRARSGATFSSLCRWTFAKSGAVIKLDGTTGDTLEFLVQDDLSLITEFHIKAQGHIAE